MFHNLLPYYFLNRKRWDLLPPSRIDGLSINLSQIFEIMLGRVLPSHEQHLLIVN